jgi:hypothetical protein
MRTASAATLGAVAVVLGVTIGRLATWPRVASAEDIIETVEPWPCPDLIDWADFVVDGVRFHPVFLKLGMWPPTSRVRPWSGQGGRGDLARPLDLRTGSQDEG